MGIIDRAKAAYAVMTTKELYNSLGTVVRNYTPNDEFRPARDVRGITYKAIDKIGTSASEYKPVVKGKDEKVIANHSALRIINKPNIKMNNTDFVHLWAMHRYIYGETFWYLARGERTRQVKEVYLMNPAAIELVVEDGELQGYILHKSNGQRMPLEVEEVYHDKRPNPFNEWRGMSIVEQAALYTNTEITTAEFTLNYIRNSGSPSGIVSLPNMTKETFQQFAAQWRENYEGPKNAGKTAFIRGEGTDYKAVGATLKDIDQKVTRDMAKEDVLMMLEVPMPLLGKSGEKGLGRADIDSLYYIFNKEVINKLHERLDDIWNDLLVMGNRDMQNGQYIDHVSIVPEDKDYKLAHQKVSVNRWVTVNEARAMDGLEPIPGGDVLMTNNATPIDQTKSIKKKVVFKKAPSKADQLKKELADNEAMRVKVVELSELYSSKVKAEIDKFAAKQEAKVIGNINATSKSFEDWTFEIKEQAEVLALALMPLFLELMIEQTASVANFITGQAIEVTPEIKARVEARILRIAGVYNEETLRSLEKMFAEAVSNGDSLVKIKKQVEEIYSKAKGYRAERIARTETLKASNLSAELTYKQSGYSKVQYFANPGACEFCQALDGQVREIGKNFYELGSVITGTDEGQLRLDYDNLDVPPTHSNCRCSLVPLD